MKLSNTEHYNGEINIFNGKLIALAGSDSGNVEIFDKDWENINPIGNSNQSLVSFSTLVLSAEKSDIMFVFGKDAVFRWTHFLYRVVNDLNNF